MFSPEQGSKKTLNSSPLKRKRETEKEKGASLKTSDIEEETKPVPPTSKLMFRFFSDKPKVITTESLQEFFYMIDIDHLKSILEKGILSHKRVEKLKLRKKDISNSKVQDGRAKKILERVDAKKKPRSLHRFVNIYLNPHNAMMHNVVYGDQAGAVKKTSPNDLCILRISNKLLTRGDVILTDQNAASKSVQFFVPASFSLDESRSAILADVGAFGFKYRNEDGRLVNIKDGLALFKGMDESTAKDLRKQIRQAELLVPYRVDPTYIVGVFTANKAGKEKVDAIVKSNLNIKEATINAELFFPSQYSPLNQYNAAPIEKDERDIDSTLPESDTSDDETEQKASQYGGGWVTKLTRS